MVSLRRKKFKEMEEGAKRRSARLLALEELKSERAVLALPVDLQQKRADGHSNLRKRGRKRIQEIDGEVQGSQEVGSSINGNLPNSPSASRRTADRIISYILDMLEVKDTHELFSMPDNLQTYDYEESMKQPGDFATLRQKYTDKMYTTLEHFENDVLTVFHKAIDSNAPNTIPFREAMTQLDHVKQIFQSLRNNLSYAELELSDWHQSYFKYNRRALRNDSNIGTSNNAYKPEYSSRLAVSTGMKQHTRTSNSARVRRHSQPTSSSRTRRRRAAPLEHEHPQFPEEQRRYTYKAVNDSNESLFTMFCGEPKSCVYNDNTLGYQESLRRFVKDAGPTAKLIAENKCLEYSKRVQAQSIWRPPPFGSQSKIGGQPSCFPSTQGQHFGSSNSLVLNNYGPSSESISTTKPVIEKNHEDLTFEHQACQLQTDELLTLFSLIGTPEFLQRSLASSSKQDLDSERGFSSFFQGINVTPDFLQASSSKQDPGSERVFSSFLHGMNATQSSVNSMKQIGPCSNSKPEVRNSQTSTELPIWQPRLSVSKPWKEREPAGSELKLSSEKEASSSASAGVYQNNNYRFNMFRGTK